MSEQPSVSSSEECEPRRWIGNFALLIQGQLVSAVGDVFYQVALGFWVLAETGSTGIMGLVMAAGVLPVVIISPFAGVIVDRTNRKGMIVAMDALRSLPVLVVAWGAFAGWVEIWMIFVVAVLVGAGGAFFNPAVGSALPDLVPERRRLKANAVYGLVHPVSGMVANAAGGVIYGLLGAPIMFLMNGVSYLVSAGSELFLRVPKITHEEAQFTLFGDMADGVRFVRGHPAVLLFVINAGVLNFFLAMGGVLILPYFSRAAAFGPLEFGVSMSILTAGSIVSLAFLTLVDVPRRARFPLFAAAAVLFSAARTFVVAVPSLMVIYTLSAVVGATVALINSFISTALQALLPQQVRGKVLALMSTGTQGLTPLGIAVGGIVAECFAIPTIMMVTGGVVFLGFLPLLLNGPVRAAVSGEEPSPAAPLPG